MNLIGSRLLEDPVATRAFLDAVLDVPGGRRTLARLSRTCKSFLQPGLGVLWRELDSLIPIISLFPSNLLKRAKRPGLGLVSIQSPAGQDWAQILKYGPLVRRLTYDEGTKAVSPSIFPMLEEHRPRTYILPNLTSLVWRVETPAGLDRINLFLSPDLQHLTLELGPKFPQLERFFADLSSRTRLQSLSITCPDSLPDNLPKLLEPQDTLERLALMAPGALSSGVGAWVASLSHLHTLQLDLTGRTFVAINGFFDDILELSVPTSTSSGRSSPSTDSGIFSGAEDSDFADLKRSALLLTDEHEARTPRAGTFARLQTLQLTGDVGNMVTFLKHVASPLQQLELTIEDPFTSTDWQDLLHLVCQYFGDSLLVFKVTGSGASRFADLVRAGRGSGSSDSPARRLPLDGLTYLPRLVRLELDLPESYGLRDADLACIAQACPSLEVARLCATARFPITGGAPGVGWDGLAALTARCVHLHTVAMPLDSTRPPDDAIFFNLAASSRAMRRLHVGHGWARDPLQAAIALSHLAPHLDSLRWFHEKNRPGYIDAHAQAWAKAAEMLPLLQAVRLTERWVAMSYMPEPHDTVDACVGTEPIRTRERAVDAVPRTAEGGVQCTPKTTESAVQAQPRTSSVEVDATPVGVDEGVHATPPAGVDESIDATPPVVEVEIDATPASRHVSISAVPNDRPVAQTDEKSIEKPASLSPPSARPSSYYIPPVISGTINLAWKVMLFGPNFMTARIHDIWRLSPLAVLYPQSRDIQKTRTEMHTNGNGAVTEMEVMDVDSEKGSPPASPHGQNGVNGISPVCI
ncbi:hypothetical protein K488DRAFT_46477 [Vararia minispora EC-137]|uniref:Uncharacterized protein n=1 Tax=Vararia minispora EC-137 TaxID=1314806 RepID=A0ACB8QQQ5_9AGAM|nr:hypothetical protein K488DRAFT_46477 [Vararia minispora EC-137]